MTSIEIERIDIEVYGWIYTILDHDFQNLANLCRGRSCDVVETAVSKSAAHGWELRSVVLVKRDQIRLCWVWFCPVDIVNVPGNIVAFDDLRNV